jgi:hypothetical protein
MARGLTALVAVCLIGAFAAADEIHRDAFSGKNTRFIAGEATVKVEEKAHDLSADRSRSLPTSEHIKLSLGAGKAEKNFAYYYYPTPAAPLTEDLSAELWVHSNKAGVQLLARVVFPKIRNPKQLDESLTRVVELDSYKAPAGGWQKLILKRPADLLLAQKQALRLELKGDPDVSDAYIDRLILNLYTGPGDVEVFVDNLEIGPVRPPAEPPTVPVVPKKGAATTAKEKEPPVRTEKGVPVEFNRGELTVGGRKVFPRFVRYSGIPMLALREAGFNGLSVPTDVPPEVLEDAIDNYRFWLVPHIPPLSDTNPERPANPLAARDADALIQAIRRFRSLDGVLFWDLGPVRSEDYRRVSRTVEAIRTADPNRPIGADVWDGYGRFSIPIQLVGTHRDPLLTSLDLDKYGQWLNQRKNLAAGTRFFWTWIQTHIPDWQFRLMYDRPSPDGCPDPVGPHPEQIRLLTYLAIANQCNALGFWSDKYLADAYQGRERLLQIALLNQEIEMLEPLLLNLSGPVTWVTSSNPSVKVAVLRTTGKGVLALPIWLGSGAQYVPPQASVQGLTFTVPQVPDGSEPWEITPVRVQSLQPNLRATPEGVQVTIPEFDLTAAVAFTTDTDPDGLLAMWQKKTRQTGQRAAAWACDLAEEQHRKVLQTHARLEGLAPPLPLAHMWIRDAERHLMEAKRDRLANNDESAYFNALRAMRPMRILMRAHWEAAIKTLDYAAATPYSVSYYTLPRHWDLSLMLATAGLGENALRDGDFEGPRPADRRGVPVTTLPGWTVQEVALDDVVMSARIVPGAEAKEEIIIPPPGPRKPYQPTSIFKRVEAPLPPKPAVGTGVLRLTITPRPVVVKKKGDKVPPEPQALERVFLAVNSPPVKLPPGSWVRISGWMKVPGGVRASADGAMFFDTAGGEAYAVRTTETLEWKHFHMYRKVPSNGEVRVRMALTGFGTAYFDDIKIEPYLGTTPPVLPPPQPAAAVTRRP